MREVLARLGLGHRENALPTQLSAGEQQRGGLAGGAVTDDGDVQRFHSGDFSVAPAQGSGMQALKNPAGAGFKKIVLDQAAGVMLDACAPFGPWVSS